MTSSILTLKSTDLVASKTGTLHTTLKRASSFVCARTSRHHRNLILNSTSQRTTTSTTCAVKSSTSINAKSYSSTKSNTPAKPASNDRNPRFALVLDIDECLVHSRFCGGIDSYRQKEFRPELASNASEKTQNNTPVQEEEEYIDSFEIFMQDGEKAVVNKRPGLDDFLIKVSKEFDVYAFSAGLEMYGKPIVEALDPEGKIFKKCFFRNDCTTRKGFFLKDLTKVRADLSQVILVDNNPISFLLQPSNGIPVPSFYNDKEDKTFDSLTKVLDNIRKFKDVRPRLHQIFHLADLLDDHRRMIMSTKAA